MEVSASTIERRVLAAARGHFISTYARLWAYQVVGFLVLASETGRPVAGSKGSPALAAWTSSARKECARALVRNMSSKRWPLTAQRTRHGRAFRSARLAISQIWTS
ncbi:hypothetical protein [Micromonospora tarensis]|uniref:hypothetical protein n=1 Tax=Micromonospora tarensis TaxID=2806100 RepID=UPI001EE47222|nr:hypothetical protein [Micromonospora tarensis]